MWVSDICIVTLISVFFSLMVSFWLCLILWNCRLSQHYRSNSCLGGAALTFILKIPHKYPKMYILKSHNRGMQIKEVSCWVHGYMFLIFMLVWLCEIKWSSACKTQQQMNGLWALEWMCLLLPGQVNQPLAGGPSYCLGAGFGKNQTQPLLLILHLSPISSSTSFFCPCMAIAICWLSVFNASSVVESGFLSNQKKLRLKQIKKN